MQLPLRRRHLGLALLAAARPARAQGYPERPVRLIVPFAPGGGVDAVARVLAEPLGATLGQAVVVENRAGAGGAVGVEAMAKSPPDGYTLAMVSPGNMTAGPAVRATPYDPLSLGFVARAVRSPLLLVCRRDLPARDLAAFVALLRREPDLVRYASGGVGTGQHLAGALLNLRTGARMVHVPYRGTGPAMADLIAGTVDVHFGDTSVWPMVQQGGVRLLAVSSKARWSEAPEVASVGDLVPDFDIANWYGVAAPPGTPAALCALLHGKLVEGLARPAVTEALRRIGFEPGPLPPDPFAAFVRAEAATWAEVVRAADIRADG